MASTNNNQNNETYSFSEKTHSIYDYKIVYGPEPENYKEMRDEGLKVYDRRIQMFIRGDYDRPSREYKGGPPFKQCTICTVKSNNYSSISFSNRDKVICGKCRKHVSELELKPNDEVVNGYNSEEEDTKRPKDEFDRFREAILAGQTESVFVRFGPNGPFIPVSRIKREYLEGQELEDALKYDRLYETLTVEEYEARGTGGGAGGDM